MKFHALVTLQSTVPTTSDLFLVMQATEADYEDYIRNYVWSKDISSGVFEDVDSVVFSAAGFKTSTTPFTPSPTSDPTGAPSTVVETSAPTMEPSEIIDTGPPTSSPTANIETPVPTAEPSGAVTEPLTSSPTPAIETPEPTAQPFATVTEPLTFLPTGAPTAEPFTTPTSAPTHDQILKLPLESVVLQYGKHEKLLR